MTRPARRRLWSLVSRKSFCKDWAVPSGPSWTSCPAAISAALKGCADILAFKSSIISHQSSMSRPGRRRLSSLAAASVRTGRCLQDPPGLPARLPFQAALKGCATFWLQIISQQSSIIDDPTWPSSSVVVVSRLWSLVSRKSFCKDRGGAFRTLLDFLPGCHFSSPKGLRGHPGF